jgi:hypothetical protein
MSQASPATPAAVPVAAAVPVTIGVIPIDPTGVNGPVSYYYQSAAAPATPLWTAPHPTETLISLICRPVSGSGTNSCLIHLHLHVRIIIYFSFPI